MKGSAGSDFRTFHQYSNPGIHSRFLYKVTVAGAGDTPEVPSFLRKKQVVLDRVSLRSALAAYCHSTPARATGDLVSKLIIKSVLDLTAHTYQLDSLVEDEVGCGCVGIKCVVQEIIVQTGGSWCLMQALYYSLSWR